MGKYHTSVLKLRHSRAQASLTGGSGAVQLIRDGSRRSAPNAAKQSGALATSVRGSGWILSRGTNLSLFSSVSFKKAT